MELIQEIRHALLALGILLLVSCCDSSDVTTPATEESRINDSVSVVGPGNYILPSTVLPSSGPPRENSSGSEAGGDEGIAIDPRVANLEFDLEMACKSHSECHSKYGAEFFCQDYGVLYGLPNNTRKYCDARKYDEWTVVGRMCPIPMKERKYPQLIKDDDSNCRLPKGEICRVTEGGTDNYPNFQSNESHETWTWEETTVDGYLTYHVKKCRKGGIDKTLKCERFPNQPWGICIVNGEFGNCGESFLVLSMILCLLYFWFGMK